MRYVIYGIGCTSALIQYLGTSYLSMNIGKESMLFREYLNWPSVLYSISVFVWFKYRKWNKIKQKKIFKFIQELSKTSFGIYLVHMYVINFICEKYSINGESIVWRIGGPFLIYSVSFILIECMQKIPIIKKIVP